MVAVADNLGKQIPLRLGEHEVRIVQNEKAARKLARKANASEQGVIRSMIRASAEVVKNREELVVAKAELKALRHDARAHADALEELSAKLREGTVTAGEAAELLGEVARQMGELADG